MKISIVTISFNQKKYLRKCIDSILNQTECDLEYIVVDPGSNDGSRELIESYGNRIVTEFAPDNGPADGLNKGFKRATGQIYGFVNSDDYLLPGALKHIADYFSTTGLNYFVTAKGFVQDPDGRLKKITPLPLTAENMIHRSAVMFQQGTFFPASAYEMAGGFNASNTTCWDYELLLRLLLKGVRNEVIEQNVAVFRLHADSISGSGRLTERYLRDLDRLFFEVCGRERGLIDKIYTYFLRLKRELTHWRDTSDHA